MFLTHDTIEQLINDGKIIVKSEFDKKDIRPVGIRIHLGRYLLIPEPGQTVDFQNPTDLKYQEVDLEKNDFMIEPNQFVLGSTYEAIQTPQNILAILDGRTTIARLGLTTHVTASILDGTFEVPHVPVLEIKNLGNFRVKLHFKDPIALMVFTELTGQVTQKIQSQYGGMQSRTTPPNLKYKTGIDA